MQLVLLAALLAALAVFLICFAVPASVTAKLAISSIIVLGFGALSTIMVARMATLVTAEPAADAGVSSRITQLAMQIQAGDINVARLAARLAHIEQGPQAADALRVVADRLNELDAAIGALQDPQVTRTQIIDALDRVAARLNDLENANFDVELKRIHARIGVLED